MQLVDEEFGRLSFLLPSVEINDMTVGQNLRKHVPLRLHTRTHTHIHTHPTHTQMDTY